MCDDIQATLAELRGKAVEVTRDVSDRGWGFSQQSACQTARSFPSTSPGIRPPFEPDGMHSMPRRVKARNCRVQGDGCLARPHDTEGPP